ncbi:MAG: transcription elongation factor GreA [Desulfohalobiaceae bacterium]|nr:transcription elongation factor GreA [Desulfohalobiaceae bacterium]
MSEIHISVQGFEKIKKELEALKKERPAVIQAIKEAREEGDLKENAGYDAARERQGMLEARISHIESRLPRFQVIDLNTMGGDKVAFGATVEIENMESGERKTYTLLGPDEADFNQGTISVYSPLARAILGQEEGETVEVDAPRGRIFYEIISIEFKGVKNP